MKWHFRDFSLGCVTRNNQSLLIRKLWNFSGRACSLSCWSVEVIMTNSSCCKDVSPPQTQIKDMFFFLFLPPSPLVLSWEKTVFPQSELLLRCCMQWHCPVCLSLPHESSMCFRSRSLARYILFNGLLLLPIGCLRVSPLVRFQGKPLITLNDFYAVCSC